MSMSVLSHAVFKHLFYIFRTVCSVKEEDLHVYVVVNFFSQIIFVFLLLLGMVMYTNEVETKEIKPKFIRKLSNFNFQRTKTLYQNNFKHIAFFFTLFNGFKCNKLYEITPKKRFLLEPEKTNDDDDDNDDFRSFYLCFLNSCEI